MWDLDSEVPTVPHASEAYPNSKVKESPGLIDHHLFEAQPRRQPCRLAPALLLAVESSVPVPAAPQGGLAVGSGAAAWRQEDLLGKVTSSSPRPVHQVLGGTVRETVPPHHLAPLCLTEAHASYSGDVNIQGSVSWEQLRLSLMRSECPLL